MEFNGKKVDPYRLFGININSTEDELKKSYRAMAIKYHSDSVAKQSEKTEQAIRLLNQAYAEVSKDMKKRDEKRKKELASTPNFAEMDFPTRKKSLKIRIQNYINELELAKVTCHLNADLSVCMEIAKLFDEAIIAARHCETLLGVATTDAEAYLAKSALEKKQSYFNTNFFDVLLPLFQSNLLFIFYSFEAQHVISTVITRALDVSATEWFMENQDALLTVLRDDKRIRQRLDDSLSEFRDDEYMEYLKDEINGLNEELINRINKVLKDTRQTYHFFTDDNSEFQSQEFYDEHYNKIKGVIENYHKKIEHREGKIKYLKFALNIAPEIEEQLRSNMHNDEAFNQMVDTLEEGIVNRYFGSSVKKN